MIKINQLTKFLQKTILEKKYLRALPNNHLYEDIFLVSYPKSGNTWLRFLIANAIKAHYKIDRKVNFFTINDIIPQVVLNKQKSKQSNQFRTEGIFGRNELPRIIKSHSEYNPYYERVILLIRDPRDVIPSYFDHLRKNNIISNNLNISDFIKHKRYGICSWYKHTNSWLINSKGNQNLQFFYYEDFLENPYNTLNRLMTLFGINLDEKALKQAIESSSREKMMELEKDTHSNYWTQIEQKSFVNSFKIPGGKKLNYKDKRYIEDYTKVLAEQLGYKYDN